MTRRGAACGTPTRIRRAPPSASPARTCRRSRRSSRRGLAPGARPRFASSWALDPFEEGAQLAVVLHAGRGLDAAADVDGVGAHEADRGGDVVGSEAAAEEERLGALVRREHAPVEAAPGAAGAALVVRVEEEPRGARRGARVGECLADAQRLHRGDAELADVVLALAAVQLDDVEADEPGDGADVVVRGIAEDAGEFGRVALLAHREGDLGGALRLDEARRVGDED